MGVTARELLLPSASSIRRLAISESGFVFDPCSGRSFTVNDTGMEVLKALQEGLSFDSLRAQLATDFEVAPQTLERDLSEFLDSLRSQLG
jgi:PqqD family protein of HPr-rel-A system